MPETAAEGPRSQSTAPRLTGSAVLVCSVVHSKAMHGIDASPNPEYVRHQPSAPPSNRPPPHPGRGARPASGRSSEQPVRSMHCSRQNNAPAEVRRPPAWTAPHDPSGYRSTAQHKRALSGPSQSDRGPRGGNGHTPSTTTTTPFWPAAARSHVVRDPPRIEACASAPRLCLDLGSRDPQRSPR